MLTLEMSNWEVKVPSLPFFLTKHSDLQLSQAAFLLRSANQTRVGEKANISYEMLRMLV